jgi:putative DeoR family transcriptional regulator (stage III sporulation protein D)
MDDTIDQRACELAVYIIETGATVRSAAKVFSISKSTVHKDLQQRLRKCDPALYHQVRQVLDKNKQERHIRGGLATKRKYQAKGTNSKECLCEAALPPLQSSG